METRRRKVQRMIYISTDTDEFLNRTNASALIEKLVKEHIGKNR
jgi:hypothetical protein